MVQSIPLSAFQDRYVTPNLPSLHQTLTAIGGSTKCMACVNSDEEHDKRHREIAELVRQLKQLQTEQSSTSQTAASPKTPTSARMQRGVSESPLSKKHHKAAKKAAKATSRTKVITNSDVQYISDVLHPGHRNNAEDEERRLLEDPDIRLNIYFHRGTSNTREMRHRFLKIDQAGKGSSDIEDDAMQHILSALQVPQTADAKSSAERKLINAVRLAIKEDLVHVHGEDQQTMMRKAGFWRWASRKAYNRLVQAGRMWDWKSGEDLQEVDDIASEASNDTASLDDEDETDAGRSHTVSSSSESRNTSVSSASRTSTGRTSLDSNTGDAGWTAVGKITQHLAGGLTFSANGGLVHLRAKGKQKKYGSFAVLDMAEEEVEV